MAKNKSKPDKSLDFILDFYFDWEHSYEIKI